MRTGVEVAERSFCTRCGVRLTPGARFCTACGTGAAVAVVGALAAGGVPWTTVRGSQAIDAREITARALPALASALPRPNLRVPALSILVTIMADIAVALLRGGPIAWPLLAARVVTGLLTAALGLAAGPAGGTVRALTALASVAFGAAQLVSLALGAIGAAGTSPSAAQLLPLVPALVTALSGLVLSIATALGAWRR